VTPQDTTIDDIARRLSEIRYQVERKQIQAAQLPPVRTEPDLRDLENRLEHEWRSLCLRAGFRNPSQQPPIPSTSRNLLLSSAQVYQEMVIAHTRDTLLSPRRQYLKSPIPSPQLEPQDPSITEEPEEQDLPPVLDSTMLEDSALFPDPDERSGMLGPPALPIYIAYL
jgi:hypothetical protein